MRTTLRTALVALLAAATLLAGAVTPAPAAAAGKFTGVSAPKISGTKRVGVQLTAKADTVTKPKAKSKTYRWLRGGKPISGATMSKYTLKAADKGKKISVKVCYKRSAYTTRCVTSRKTGEIAAGRLSVKTPKISGTTKVGSTLKASTGKWTGGAKFTYKWLRDGKTISGATKASYRLQGADEGKRLQVKVTGRKAGYASAAKTSARTAGITAHPATEALALNAARSYLLAAPYSRQAMVQQLEFEGFSATQVAYAMGHLDVSWKEQAARAAKSYVAGFGRAYWTGKQLYAQLCLDGFTGSEASHGVDSVDL